MECGGMSKIGLYDVDSKIPNLALMKLSAYHKAKGDHVEWYSPLIPNGYDKIYASKIFSFSDTGYLHCNMEIGGSGYCLTTKLPYEIEHIYPDYELYNCNYAMGFITRGCMRKCPFCVVPEKEGKIRYNAPLEEFCKDQLKVMLLDNNILAYPNHLEELQKLVDSKKRIDFNQGLDIRLITEENAKLLSLIKKWVGLDLRFALDDPKLGSVVEKKTEILKRNGIKRGRFYVLIGYNTTKEEDFYRINLLKKLGHRIFVMRYSTSSYTIKFQRWVNRHHYHYTPFEVYH